MHPNVRINILVTGVGGGAVGHQVLHALQLFGDRYRVTVVDADAYSFGLYTEASRFLVPPAASPEYIPAMRVLAAREGIQVVIPGTEIELKVLAAHKAEIEAEGCLLLVNPSPVVELCQNKFLLARWLEEHGFDTPDTADGHHWRELAARRGYPLIAKPCSGSSGSRNVSILVSEEEVLRHLAFCPADDTIFQEYVDADGGEFTVGVCVDRGSRVIDSIAIRRQLTGMTLGTRRAIDGRAYSLSTGYSQGFVVRHPKVQAACERLVAQIGICGPSNIQCRFSKGKVMVFEVHPRFSGTTSLRADVGFNEPDILIRAFLLGERMGRQDYRSDVAVIRAFQSVVVPMAEMAAVPRAK